MKLIAALSAVLLLAAPAAARPSKAGRKVIATDRKVDGFKAQLVDVESTLRDIEAPFVDAVAGLQSRQAEVDTRDAAMYSTWLDTVEPAYQVWQTECCVPSCEANQSAETSSLSEEQAGACNERKARDLDPFFADLAQLQADQAQLQNDWTTVRDAWAAVEGDPAYQELVQRRDRLRAQIEKLQSKLDNLCEGLTRRDKYAQDICWDNLQRGLDDGSDLQPSGTRFFGE